MSTSSEEKLTDAEIDGELKKLQEIINKDTIRPSHIEDKNIIYKSSEYLRDLIGEEKQNGSMG